MDKVKAIPTRYKAKINVDDKEISRRVYEKEFMKLGNGFNATEPIVKYNKEWYKLIGGYRKDKICSLGKKIEGEVVRQI